MDRPFTNALWYLTLTRDELGSDAVLDRAITHGSGCYLYDRSGKRYLDARSGLWNVTLGYGNERVARAMADELARLPGGQIVRYDQPTEIALEYGERLVSLLPTTWSTSACSRPARRRPRARSSSRASSARRTASPSAPRCSRSARATTGPAAWRRT